MSYIGNHSSTPKFFGAEPTNIDLEGGTYGEDRMYLTSTATLTGDVTVTNDLVFSKLGEDGTAITLTADSTTRTITGSGSISAGPIVSEPGSTLTGMTGELGSAVTFPAGTVVQTKAYHNDTQINTSSTSWSTSMKIVMGTITPLYADSDILLTGHIALEANANAAYALADIYKNASDVTETANLTGYTFGIMHMNDAGIFQSSGFSWLDTCSENSTTEKTYGISLRAEYAGGGTARAGWGTNVANVMIIQEIKR